MTKEEFKKSFGRLVEAYRLADYVSPECATEYWDSLRGCSPRLFDQVISLGRDRSERFPSIATLRKIWEELEPRTHIIEPEPEGPRPEDLLFNQVLKKISALPDDEKEKLNMLARVEIAEEWEQLATNGVELFPRNGFLYDRLLECRKVDLYQERYGNREKP